LSRLSVRTPVDPIPTVNIPANDRAAILQVVPRLDTGGAERTTVDVAAALAEAGFAPYVASEGGRMAEELTRKGGLLLKLPLDSKAPHALIANVFRLRHIIRKRNIALVHARSRAPAWSAFYAARLSGVPFVTTYHGIYNAKNPLKRYYNSVMAKGDTVIANSQWTAAHIEAEYRFRPKRLVVIPRGIDLARFSPDAVAPSRVDTMRRQWGVGTGETIVLLPGRMTRWKGQAVLVDALGLLKGTGLLDNLRVVFAGDSQGRDSYVDDIVKALAAQGLAAMVSIAGHVGDMPAAYLASDIVVSASTDPEAFGRVAAEAGAMERAVIATDHGGSREIVLPGKSGMLIAPGSPAALAAALRAMLEAGPEARAMMGMAARAHVEANFTVEKMCADTLGVYRDLLARRT
jgi:glycosyltransferase involved in cell wall biosynthesis